MVLRLRRLGSGASGRGGLPATGQLGQVFLLEEPGVNAVTIKDPEYKTYLDTLPSDGINIFMLEQDSIRGALVSGTRLLAAMSQNHGLGLLETLVLGHAYLAAALLSVTIKGEDRLVLRAEADGPAKGFSVECSAQSTIRGRLFCHDFELPQLPDALDTAPLLGQGFLSLTRHQAGRTEPVYGTVALRSGRLAEDLAWYFHESEQLPTSFTLGIQFDQAGRVAGAGGLYLQALPQADPEALDRVERLVYSMPQLGKSFSTGLSRMDLMLRMFPFFDLNMMAERAVEFYCPCDKKRLGSFLSALSAEEKADVLVNGPFPLEISCQNCGSVYSYDRSELELLCR